MIYAIAATVLGTIFVGALLVCLVWAESNPKQPPLVK